MADPLDSLTQYVATDLNLGTIGTTVFQNYAPDKADGSYDNIIVLYDMPGQPPALTIQDDTDFPGFQVLCRNLDSGAAKATTITIRQALHGLHAVTIHGTFFKLIAAIQSSAVHLGRDERQRFAYTVNFRSMVQGVTR